MLEEAIDAQSARVVRLARSVMHAPQCVRVFRGRRAAAASELGATKADPFDRAAVDLCGVGVSIIY